MTASFSSINFVLFCICLFSFLFFFFFNDTATTEIYTLSLHDALPIFHAFPSIHHGSWRIHSGGTTHTRGSPEWIDRKSTRLNSSHRTISYAVFCLKKKKKKINTLHIQ